MATSPYILNGSSCDMSPTKVRCSSFMVHGHLRPLPHTSHLTPYISVAVRTPLNSVFRWDWSVLKNEIAKSIGSSVSDLVDIQQPQTHRKEACEWFGWSVDVQNSAQAAFNLLKVEVLESMEHGEWNPSMWC